MSDLDRVVAGIRCREVLEDLGEYVDRTLSPEAVERIDAHLRGCDRCERFGGHYASLVRELRAVLTDGDERDSAVVGRLRARLDEVWAGETR